jgi:pSer/pThr/pTyr-binding forkhead associated (FHA) protein/S1-C subfamily serine protease
MRWLTVALLALLLAQPAAAQSTRDVESVFRIFVPAAFPPIGPQQQQQQQQQRPNQPREALFFGTGFLAAGQRFVVTNNHVVSPVVRDGNQVVRPTQIRFFIGFLRNGQPALVEARLVMTAPDKDLALLEALEDLPGTPVTLADYDSERDIEVEAVGFPGLADLGVNISQNRMQGVQRSQLEPFKTQGRLQRRQEVTNANVSGNSLNALTLLHTAQIAPGNSGGPLFNRCGQVIGVNTFGPAQAQVGSVFNFSIASQEVVRFLRSQNQSPRTATGVCFFANTSTTEIITISGVTLTALLALVALILARKRPAVIQGSVSALQRGFSRIVQRPPALPGAAFPPPPGRLPQQTPAPPRPPAPGPLTGAATQLVTPGGVPQPIAVTPSPAADRPPGLDTAATALFPAQGGALVANVLPAGFVRFLPINGGDNLEVPAARVSDGQSVILGRSPEGGAVLNDKTVSRRHARLWLDSSNGLNIVDLGSSGGTYKGGARIKSATYSDGEEVRFGSVIYRVSLPARLAGTPAGWSLSGVDGDNLRVDVHIVPKRDRATGLGIDTLWSIGRNDEASDIVISGGSVSSSHARLRYRQHSGLEISDVGSSNGTFVDGRQIGKEYVSLASAREIRFGDHRFALKPL